MELFLSFCFLIALFAVPAVALSGLLSLLYKNRMAAFYKISETGIIGALAATVFSFVLPQIFAVDSVHWTAVLINALFIIAGCIRAHKNIPAAYN